jgi:hypothetical protein
MALRATSSCRDTPGPCNPRQLARHSLNRPVLGYFAWSGMTRGPGGNSGLPVFAGGGAVVTVGAGPVVVGCTPTVAVEAGGTAACPVPAVFAAVDKLAGELLPGATTAVPAVVAVVPVAVAVAVAVATAVAAGGVAVVAWVVPLPVFVVVAGVDFPLPWA